MPGGNKVGMNTKKPGSKLIMKYGKGGKVKNGKMMYGTGGKVKHKKMGKCK